MRRAHLPALSPPAPFGLLLLALAPLFSLGGGYHEDGRANGVSTPFFDVSEKQGERSRRLLNAEKCREASFEGVPCWEIEPDTDPYSKVQWHFRLERALNQDAAPFVVEIRFFDKGAGTIEPLLIPEGGSGGGSLSPTRRASFTRLNTHRFRSAFFEFDPSSIRMEAGPLTQLAVSGLQYLARIEFHTAFTEADWNQAFESIPRQVEPMIQLERPIHLVTSAEVSTQGATTTLETDLRRMRELVPLAKVLGFTSIESYVRWDWLEPNREGEFDFRALDRIVEEIRSHQMKWFPLLVVGSAYALPKWFMESSENVGFVCVEHGLSNPIQSIWSPYLQKHVTRVLQAFGNHYEPMGVLEGVRLGPSGNYGESQYPAGGNWPPEGAESMHIHIGFWAGDPYAQADFRRFVKDRYPTQSSLNSAWETAFTDLSEVAPILPQTIPSRQRRLDTTEWYTDCMTEWCDWWAQEAGKALPNTKIYQSSGGWGFRESGTDFTAQTKSMIQIQGGIRLTNETDSFDQNFYVTRLAATAARLYGVDLGYEPASSHTARGTVGRIFNTAVTNGDHFFTYSRNIMKHPMSIAKWLKYLPILDTRQDPLIEVAIYYPETMNQLDDGAFRNLYAWGFYPRAREIRRHLEVDYLDDRLIREGFLDRYKVLVHVWGDVMETKALERLDGWLRKGGVLIYPSFPRGALSDVEGATMTFRRWVGGDTGLGAFHRYPGDMEPPSLYGDFVKRVLLKRENLHPWTKQVLRASFPDRVFCSIQEDGHLLVLNYGDQPATFNLEGEPPVSVEPYGIERMRIK